MHVHRIGSILSAFVLSVSTAYAAVPQQQFADMGDLQLENKATINDCSIGYRTFGTLNADKSNVILFATWHTGTSRDAAGMLQSGALFDPAAWYVIVVDALGNGVSCSPSNSKTQPGPAFPQFSVRDMVASQHKLLTEKLGIKHARSDGLLNGRHAGLPMGGQPPGLHGCCDPDRRHAAPHLLRHAVPAHRGKIGA